MGIGNFIHHIGSFLLFVATVLLIITDISAPVVSNISMLRVELSGDLLNDNRPVITFGTFGWCVKNTMAAGDFCSRSMVGYDPTVIVEENMRGVDFSDYASATAKGLSHVMVLHPVATVLTFLAFLLAVSAGVVGSILSVLVALLSFVVTLVALVCDFVSFAIVRSEVNGSSGDAMAFWGSGSWTLLASAACSLIAAIIVFFTCCSARRRHRREASTAAKYQEGYGTPVRRRRFWNRR